ncbi:MAG: LD-carboxypeptidase [Oscillospiraceae bacterium]|nr:LD-carboxypeptidase [Oscillospiraceae bacterium]
MLFPTAPQAGDLIALLSPSSPLVGDPAIEEIAASVEALGFRTRICASCRSETARGYAAAEPLVRVQDLHEAFADPEVKAVWCVRGGSTAWQLLPLLDFDLIARNPKPFIGFSDITTLHTAFQQRCGFITFHGPHANCVPKWEDFTRKSLQNALMLRGRLQIENPPEEAVKTLGSGRVSGVLTGGNLSLTAASVGTPWQIDAAGKILYLEDVGEAVYALERMLNQLLYAGILESAAGLAFGVFTDCQNAYRKDYGPEQLLQDFFAGWQKPVLYNLFSAHCTPMSTLPLGAVCTLDADTGTMTITR